MTDKTPITVADFLRHYGITEIPERAGRRAGETKLVVRRHALGGGIGATPIFNVVGLYNGFDWDDGKLFLDLDFPVHAAGDEFERERAMSREMSETLGFIYLALTRRGDTPEQKIRNIVSTLRARTGMKLKDVIPGETPDVMEAVGKMVDQERAKKGP